jgi:glycosyltransferase involved in cell wall biosynthesis
MRILHVIPRLLGGGPERHLLALVQEWQRMGFRSEHQIAVLDKPLSAPLVVRARRLGIQLITSFNSSDNAELDEAIRNADVVAVKFWNHPHLLELLRRPWPATRVLLSSVVAGTTSPQVLFAELGKFADSMVLSSPVSHGTAAVRAAADALRPVDVVPSLWDTTRLEGFAAEAHDGIRVGYLGLVEPTKMHPRFAELSAAVRNPNVYFEIVGSGKWIPQLTQLFYELGLGDRIRFHGHVEDLRRALGSIDILGYPLAPDTYATCEKALQEAMWAGIPPVVLAGNGASHLVTHERTGIVCPSEAEYGAAIDRLADDSTLRWQLGEAARSFAHDHFDPVRNAITLRQIFEATAALPSRERAPLPRFTTAAGSFVNSLGALSGPFATSLEGTAVQSAEAVALADAAIAASSPVLAQGEGGVFHYRKTFPEDPHLHLWASLIARFNRDGCAADIELESAVRLGLPVDRAMPTTKNATGSRVIINESATRSVC